MTRSARSTWLRAGLWVALLAAMTIGFVLLRPRVERVHVALAYLVVVLGGSATGGRAIGRALAVLSYLAFHYFFVEHFDSLQMSNPMDALILIAFLGTALFAERLVTQAQEQADAARLRTAEVERIAGLGAETLGAGRAEDAVRTIAEVIRTSLGATRCDLTDIASRDTDGTTPSSAPTSNTLELPLRAHGQDVGRLRLQFAAPTQLTAEQRRFLDALAYYAALAVDRVRLVAEAERAEAQAQADALRASLVAGLSHDIRTPLTSIKGLASRIDPEAVPEGPVIVREVDRLTRLANDLLDLSRLNAGALPMQRELNTLADLVGAALQRRESERKAGRIHVAPFDERVGEATTATFDFVQTLRVVENLLDNALKYSSAQQPIEISVHTDDSCVTLEIADRGPGIAESERDRVFDPFYRAAGVPPDAGGAGLGLAIARRLAREQGGDVTCLPRDGGGSRFVLTLPADNLNHVAP